MGKNIVIYILNIMNNIKLLSCVMQWTIDWLPHLKLKLVHGVVINCMNTFKYMYMIDIHIFYNEKNSPIICN